VSRFRGGCSRFDGRTSYVYGVLITVTSGGVLLALTWWRCRCLVPGAFVPGVWVGRWAGLFFEVG